MVPTVKFTQPHYRGRDLLVGLSLVCCSDLYLGLRSFPFWTISTFGKNLVR